MKYDNNYIFLTVLLIAALVLSLFTIYVSGDGKPTLSAKSAVLYDPESETFIYEKNPDEKLPMASTTKIMTALVAADYGNLNKTLTVPKEAVGTEGSSAYFTFGETMTLEDALYALLLQSANDAAIAIAHHISKDVESFAKLMNSKATELGLQYTSFANPHGLDDDNHYTTARELAIITAAALKNSKIAEIVSTQRKTVTTSTTERTFVNHNKLLRMYDGCNGVKTGFTKRCGRCLVGSARKDGLTLISVTLDAPSDWSDHISMFDYGFSEYERRTPTRDLRLPSTLPVVGGKAQEVLISLDREFSYLSKKNEKELDEYVAISKFAIAPISKGDILGSVIYTKNGTVVERINIISKEDIEEVNNTGFFSRLYGNIINFIQG